MRSPFRIVSPLLVLAIALVLVACGGGDDGAPDVAQPSPDAATTDAMDAGGADAAVDALAPDGGRDAQMDGADTAGDADEDGTDTAPDTTGGCRNDDDCADADLALGPCQRATCDQRDGTCVAAPITDGGACDDGDACTFDTVCRGGLCVGRAVSCDDGEWCTVDRCDPVAGCEHIPRGAACDDGDPCTEGDACEAGVCVSGAPVCPCDDDEDCAPHQPADRCAGRLACEAAPDGTGAACRLVPDSPVRCEAADDPPCSPQRCDPTDGLCKTAPLPDGTPCDDGDVCTEIDVCDGGACVPGATRGCDDGNPCTDDRCDPAAGCLHPPRQQGCDDGDGCTLTDRCQAGACYPGAENRCLEETCVPARTLECGASDSWSRTGSGSTDFLAAYDCDASGQTGPEITYMMVAPFDGVAEVRLRDAAPEVSVFVLEAARRGCDTRGCRVAAAPDATFAVTAGHTYYLVVDAPAGVAPEFALELDCRADVEMSCDDRRDDDGDGDTDCDDGDCASDPVCAPAGCRVASELRCDVPITGRSDGPGHTDTQRVYGCGEALPVLDGPELRYAFTVPADGTYTFELSGPTAPLSVVVTDNTDAPGAACSAGACRGRGAGRLELTGQAGERWIVLVDSEEEPGAYTLTARCPAAVERDCADGEDDDGDGDIDCLDGDCADAPTCGDTCRADSVLRCGDTIVDVNGGPGHTERLERYPCSLFAFDGPERAYRVEAPPGASVTVTLEEGPEALDVFLLAREPGGACAAQDCVAQGDRSVGTLASADRELIAVVDGHAGASGAFVLHVACTLPVEADCADGVDEDGDGDTDCRDADCAGSADCRSCDGLVTGELRCGDVVDLSTRAAAATDGVDRWGCNANDYSGRERIYSFVPEAGWIATFVLSDEDAPLDVLVIEDEGLGCNPASCLNYSPYRTRNRLVGERRYWVVIEGYGGAEGAATLNVYCED